MPRFSYTAYDDNGARATGVIDSETREAAIESLFRQGRYPLELIEGGRLPTPRWWEREVFGPRRMSRRSVALLTRELATLVKAELPIDEALRIARLQPLLPARSQQVIARVLDRVVEGASLSEALGQEATTFPAYYARVVQAGEAAGTLGQSLDELAGFLERESEFRARIGSALLYPGLLLIAAAGALARHHDGPDPDGGTAVQGRGRTASVHHSVPARRAGDDRRALAARSCGRRGNCRRLCRARPQRALADCGGTASCCTLPSCRA